MKRIASLLLVLLPLVFTLSCKEKEDPQKVEKASLSVVVTGADGVVTVPMYQSRSLDVKVTAEPGPAAALNVTVGTSAELVASYNAQHGTSYALLPADAYELPSAPFVLPRYNKTSPVATLRLKGAGCELDKEYILPIVVAKAEGADWEFVDDNAAYIAFKMSPAEQQGSGTAADPYLINDVNEFLKVGNLLKDNDAVYFKMAGDVDFSGIEYTEENPWKPVNYAAPDDDDAKPAARARVIHFDGNGHKISNFKAGGPLFGTFCGSIRDLTVEGAAVDSDTDDGAIIIGVAGASDKEDGFSMKNVKVVNSTLINDYKRGGALVAHMRNGIVENCEAACSVTAQQQGGGLIGRVDAGTITGCTASGSVAVTAYYVGGLIGYAEKVTVKSCSASGNVTADGSYARSGGLIGEMHGGSVEKSVATGDVEGTTGHFAGGLIGVADAVEDISITGCYATGKVTYSGTSNKAGYGGLLGRMEKGIVTITNCYSTGAVKAFRWSAGFVGDVNKGVLTVVNGYTSSDISAIGPDGNGAFQRGLLIGQVRVPAETTIKCSKFIAWKTNDADEFCFPADAVSTTGNYYGNEGTVSRQAKALGWDESIWDLGKDLPTLK